MSRDTAGKCRCPYCDGPSEKESTICTPCSVTIRRCEKCGRVLEQEQHQCPDCGRGQSDPTRRNR
jgi:predicted amidophosphoribosyltransferase